MNSEDTAFISADEESRTSVDLDESERHQEFFQTLKGSFLKAFKVMDRELRIHCNIDCYCSGTTAVTLIKQQAATCLSELDQSPPSSIMESMQPFLNAIVKPELLKHQDRDVKLLVATCICEITRITAPEAPYNDDVLKDIFHLIVGTFNGLSDTNGPSFGRRVVILETLAKYRSCVVMLDLVAVVLRLFFPKHFPDWLELPAALILLIVVAPSLFSSTIRNDWIGVVICLAIACYLLQEHIRASGGFRNSFTRAKGISNTVGIVLLFVYPAWALVTEFL